MTDSTRPELFHFLEEPGPSGVGLAVVEQYDCSRAFRHAAEALGRADSSQRARPIQTLIWYPAQVSKAMLMTVGDYVSLASTETCFSRTRMSRRSAEWLAGMKPTVAQPMWAVRDAAPSPGRFPVVVYAPSYSGAAWENADLCEYLASYGYLVLASPSMGARSRNMTSDLEGVEAQAKDIAFLISYAHTLPNADPSRLAVAGFSWGGLSNLFAAARDPRIAALIAFDGSLRYWSGLIGQAGYVKPQEMSIPLIYFAQGTLSLEDQARYFHHNDGPSALNAWMHGDLTTVDMLGMTHAEYSSMFQRNEDLWWKLTHVYHQKDANFGRAEGATGYVWVARYTRQFLDAYLKQDASAMTFLRRTPAENGVPRYVMSVNHRPAVGPPATFDTFRAELAREGFEHIAEVYACLQQRSSDFRLSEEALNEWAEDLLDGGHPVEAVTLLTFGLRVHPESSVLHTTLGEAREVSGDTEQALASYRCAIAKDPQNADAAWKLNRLSQTRVS